MTRTLILNYKLVSWGCTILAWTNGAILLWDGCTNGQHRLITLVVALLFGVIGGIVLGVERSLNRIYRCSESTFSELSGSESARSWKLLFLYLVTGKFLIVVAMGGGLAAIIGRLLQGFHIFG